MDPISIVASSLAFAGAVLSGLEAFKTLYDAGPDLGDLLSELTETKLMLVDIEKALTNHELEEDLRPDRFEGLRRLLLEEQKKLEILSALVSEKLDFSNASISGSRIARLAWLRYNGKVKRIQSSPNQTRERITATLGAANLYETALIRLKLDDLAGLHQEYTDQWTRHGRALDFISVNIHRLGLVDSPDPAGRLQRNADCTESTFKENKTPSVCSDDILYAVNYNHHGLSKFLIESGASPDAEDKKQATCVALSWERIFGRNTESSDMVESWRYLFDDEEYLESRIFPPLHKIVLGLCRDDLERQLERSTSFIDEQDIDGRTALSWAAAKANLKDVDTLLKFGADPNIPSKRGHTSLSWAAQSASRIRKDVIQALLENGAVANWVDSSNRTPLVYATSEFDDPDCLRLLVEGGADVNLRDCHSRTPLGYAARMGRVNNLRYLLSCGADCNIPDHWGYTPLFEAVYQNHHEALQVLLANDSTLSSTKANGGMSILHVVAVSGDLLTIEILADHGDLTILSEDLPNDDGDTARDLFARRQSIEKEHRAAFERLLDKASGGPRFCSKFQACSMSDASDEFDFAVEGMDTFVDAVEVQASVE